jgi:hypothetical protein
MSILRFDQPFGLAERLQDPVPLRRRELLESRAACYGHGDGWIPGRWRIFVPMPPRSPLSWKPNGAIRPDGTVRSQRKMRICQAAGS